MDPTLLAHTSLRPIVRCEDTVFAYGGRRGPLIAIDRLTWRVMPQSINVVVGPSGCGKSTLLRAIAGLHTATSGLFEVALPPSRALSDYSATFQTPALLPWLTVLENALLAFRITGSPVTSEVLANVNVLFQRVGLDQFVTAYPHELSGGMRMRLAVVRAFLTRPKLMTMDEPFAALDEFTRERMCAELESLWLSIRNTIVFVTHNLSEAVFLADEIAVLSARPGRLIATVPVDLPRPREERIRSSASFVALVDRVRKCLVEEQALADAPRKTA